jgi:homocysteine S-methyltransferase
MADHVGREGVRDALSSNRTFMTFAGVETYLVFLQQYALREFCAFEILDDDDGWNQMVSGLLRPIADSCAEHGHGLMTDAFVWRAAPDFLARLGYGEADLARLHRQALVRVKQFVADWRAEAGERAAATPVILSAEIGPRGDGYDRTDVTVEDAAAYHTPQIEVLADTDVDLLAALTMSSVNETVGMIRVAREHGLPITVSPTVETDGTLPDGTRLREFVESVDDATDGYAVFHMINCAHPEHFVPALDAAKSAGEPWVERIKGARVNASNRSHEELDSSDELDRGDVAELARQVGELHAAHSLAVVGGCCGTDAEHAVAMARSCAV